MSIVIAIVVNSTIVLAAAGLAAALLGKAPASLRHTVWMLALGALFVLPLAETLLPKIDLPVLPRERAAATEMQSGPEVGMPEAAPAASAFVASQEEAPPALAETLPVVPPTRRLPWPISLWAAGATLVWSRFLIGSWKLARLRARSVAGGPDWEQALGPLRRAMGLGSDRVELRVSEAAVPPMSWGYFRPVVMVPAASESWSDAQRDSVLAHELAHVLRRDPWNQLLAQIVLGLYWFHPLVWYALGRMKLERERASDDRVLLLGTKPQEYSDHLLAVTRGMAPMRAALTMAGPSQIETRLKAILDPRVKRMEINRLGRAALAVTAAVIVLAAASSRVVAAGEAYPTPPVAAFEEPVKESAGVATPVTPQREPVPVEEGVTPQAGEAPIEGEEREIDGRRVTELPLVGQDLLDLLAVLGEAPQRQDVAGTTPGEDGERVRRIRPNDVVRIHVFNNPDLSASVRVQEDGRLSSPLVQDLRVEGDTPGELAERLEARLSQYLTAPQVTVLLESGEDYRFYVTGAVREPGSYVSPKRLTVLQALAIAGGFSQFARPSEITIIRSQPGEPDAVFRFDYQRAVNGQSDGGNILLEPGDVVSVP